MLEFDTSGLLKPYSIITTTIEEFEKNFAVDSPGNIRRSLFKNYLEYCHRLKEACEIKELKQWIDGSFVTKKLRPFDIDLVNFIDFKIFAEKENQLKEFVYPESAAIYGLDCYLIEVYPEGDKSYFAYQADRAYWINQFDKTKPDSNLKRNPKGFLEIIV